MRWLILWLLAVPAFAGPPADAGGRSVFVHLFEWRWDDVAQECETVLGPAGFSAVQVSPPSEHVDHRSPKLAIPYAWWARYQPVSFELLSRSGDTQAFASMVARCRAAGVGVYVDAVLNHMADQVGVGLAGSRFDREQRRYPDFEDRHFNRFCKIGGEDYQASDDPAENAARAERLRRCQLLDLPDLDNSNAEVRARHVAYLQQLLDLGVAGFRIDAAKHMFPQDISAMLQQLDGDFYVFQEVVDTRGEPVGVSDYAAVADVTEFLYSKRLGEAFASGKLDSLQALNEAGGLLTGSDAVVFVDNHDNQRGHGMSAATTHRDGAVYDLANVFLLGWPYGYPKLMSSYAWDGVHDSAGPPHDGDGNTLPVYAADGRADCGGERWVCEHRRPSAVAMVGFRNRARAVGATEVAHWWSDGAAGLAFAVSRGEWVQGFVAINRNSDQPLTERLQTGLPAGRYRNLLGTPETVEVDADGLVEIRLGSLQALAVDREHVVD
jgi:alpha-amylase